MLVTNVGQTGIQNSAKHLIWSVLRSLKLFSQNAKIFYFQKLFSTYMETRYRESSKQRNREFTKTTKSYREVTKITRSVRNI